MKHLKHSQTLVLSFLLIGLIMVSGCISQNKPSESALKSEYKYEVKITTNSSEYYFVYCPIPIWSNLSVSSMVNNLSFVTGTGNYTIINTEKGLAINITGNGNLSLLSMGESTVMLLYDVLSMQNDSDNDGKFEYYGRGDIQYWAYCSMSASTSIEITVYNKDSGGYGYRESDARGIVENGWNIIYGSQGTVVS